MSDIGLPLFRLYVFCGVCALLGAAYGYLALEPSAGMRVLAFTGPSVSVATWLAGDARRTRTGLAQDAGLFFYMTVPLTILWYSVHTRGRNGWRLAALLYVLALAGVLGGAMGELMSHLFM